MSTKQTTVRRRARKQRGAYTVETALILPVVLLATLGAMDLARAMYQKHLVREAAMVGARLGSLPGVSESEVSAEIAGYLTTVGVVDYEVSIENVGTAVLVGKTTSITVSMPFEPVTGDLLPLGGTDGIVLTETVKMRHE